MEAFGGKQSVGRGLGIGIGLQCIDKTLTIRLCEPYWRLRALDYTLEIQPNKSEAKLFVDSEIVWTLLKSSECKPFGY